MLHKYMECNVTQIIYGMQCDTNNNWNVLHRKVTATQQCNTTLCSGLLHEECQVLRQKLAEKESLARSLATKQQQLIGTNDNAQNEVNVIT